VRVDMPRVPVRPSAPGLATKRSAPSPTATGTPEGAIADQPTSRVLKS
jgi:hypothetical protein